HVLLPSVHTDHPLLPTPSRHAALPICLGERRKRDLLPARPASERLDALPHPAHGAQPRRHVAPPLHGRFAKVLRLKLDEGPVERSEEHTSELQSRVDLVCRLLLENKKL